MADDTVGAPADTSAPGPEPVSERDRQIEGYHAALHALFKGADDVLIAQSVASFMGCTMAHSSDWRRVIPGFVREMLDYANLAQAAHLHSEGLTIPKMDQQQETPSGDDQGTEET